MNRPTNPELIEDVQSSVDKRHLDIDQVGIRAIKHPVIVKDKKGGVQHTVANFNMYVHLPHNFKGTHMSRFVEILDGIISLSGYLPDKVKKTFTPKIPILALHGIHDDIIKIEYAKESYKKFLSEDNFSFLTFYKGHEVIFEEIEHIKKFLMRI